MWWQEKCAGEQAINYDHAISILYKIIVSLINRIFFYFPQQEKENFIKYPKLMDHDLKCTFLWLCRPLTKLCSVGGFLTLLQHNFSILVFITTVQLLFLETVLILKKYVHYLKAYNIYWLHKFYPLIGIWKYKHM